MKVCDDKEGLRVRSTEFLTTVSGTASGVITKKMKYREFGLAMLDSLSKSFDRCTINSMMLEYRPAVGTSTNGTFAMAIDWDSSDSAPTPAKLRVMQPQHRGPVWQPGVLRLPVHQLQRLINVVPGDDLWTVQLAVPAVTSEFGEVLVCYDISMMGPSGN